MYDCLWEAANEIQCCDITNYCTQCSYLVIVLSTRTISTMRCSEIIIVQIEQYLNQICQFWTIFVHFWTIIVQVEPSSSRLQQYHLSTFLVQHQKLLLLFSCGICFGREHSMILLIDYCSTSTSLPILDCIHCWFPLPWFYQHPFQASPGSWWHPSLRHRGGLYQAISLWYRRIVPLAYCCCCWNLLQLSKCLLCTMCCTIVQDKVYVSTIAYILRAWWQKRRKKSDGNPTEKLLHW